MTTSLRLFNTASRSVEEIVPRESDVTTVYTCGPTVYGAQHIGNYRMYISEDLLVKTLRYFDYNVKRVMNITDVGHLTSDQDDGEDKLEVGARREGKTAWEVAKRYEADFLSDLDRLHIERPEFIIRATDTIEQQIALIKRLEEKGYTYQIGDGIYFDSSKFPTYGEMAKLDLSGLQAGARVAMQVGKKHLTDFALWKFSSADHKRDMEWESPWGKGFPGWHIECSAIAMSYLGEQIDLHAGGVDHIPVHHTNEIAQSEAATGKQFVKHWMHGEFLLVDGGKMSKSLGNIHTLADLEEQGFDLLALRYLFYSASYRAKLNFTWEALQSAQVSLRRLRAHIEQLAEGEQETDISDLKNALSDDLNTPQVLAALWELLRSDRSDQEKRWAVGQIDQVLSLDLFKSVELAPDEILGPIQDLLKERGEARLQKNWARSDELRQQIEALGFAIKDTTEQQVLTRLKK